MSSISSLLTVAGVDSFLTDTLLHIISVLNTADVQHVVVGGVAIILCGLHRTTRVGFEWIEWIGP